MAELDHYFDKKEILAFVYKFNSSNFKKDDYAKNNESQFQSAKSKKKLKGMK